MKKLFLMMGLASLFMVACNNAPKQQEQTNEPEQEVVAAEEHHCPFCPLKADYANWDNMDETAKAELNKKAYDLFAEMDAKKAECEAQCAEQKAECGEKKECCEQKAECEEKKECCEKMAKCAADWANFENLTLDEQKDVILCRIAALGMGGDKCQKEGEGHQCQHGEGHECQHGK